MDDDELENSAHGAGKWDIGTSRYIPIGGGSRSRVEEHAGSIRPYLGFAGLYRKGEEKFDSIKGLYSKIGGGSRITAQDRAYVAVTIDPKEE